ncbi:DNA repair protein Rad52 [Rhodocaloribacter litoris]|uniref:Rad52/Rad22 family DNA repair protein n=1 Tax=Rhodocaloribacter litoris TaxID=2558931 RepID=UPI00141EF485|nr:Rad52/Rad22 family DNA repair protein [Rhodocaloribacter litoris]QXD14110.1 DNA repair protein Rad52 [Rhodocaloribacter litoris]
MPGPIDLHRLQAFFDPEDIGWKPIAVSKKTGKALVAAYVTNRAIMDRLDSVCGPENWRNEFVSGPEGGVLCGLSIRIVREDGTAEWVTKWDGAENTDVEPVKGGLSSSMRRAAVQWGIGRYLYDLPSQWVSVDERGRITQTPPIPPEFRPRSSGDDPAPGVRSEASPSDGDASTPRRVRPRDPEAARYFMPRQVKS